METDMTVGSPVRVILNFTLPIFIGNIFQQLYNMADAVIVGKFVGPNALAAVGSCGTLMFLIIGFLQGLTAGFTVITAQHFGAGNKKAMRQSVASAYILSAIVSVIMTVLSMSMMKQILGWMNTPPEIYSEAYGYIMVICAGIVAQVLYNLLASILRALGNSKVPLYFLILAAFLNVVLDLVFIIVFHMGAAGAAYATVISQGVSGIACLIYIIKKVPDLHLKREDWKLHRDLSLWQIKIGLPMALQYSITAIGTIMVQAALNTLGALSVASFAAASKIEQVVSQAYVALGTTMATYCAQNMGAGKLDRIGKGLLSASLIGFGASLICFLIALLGGRQLTLLFVDAAEAQIIEYSYEFLLFCTGGYCLLTLVNTVRFTIQGMGFSIFAIVSGVMEMIARILASAVLVPFLGYAAICMAHPMAWIFADIFLIPAFFWCRQQIGKKRCM